MSKVPQSIVQREIQFGLHQYVLHRPLAPNIVSVADKDAIRKILVTADYPKSEIHEGLELYNQHNLFSSRNKDFHKNRV